MTTFKKHKRLLVICLLVLINRENFSAQTNEFYINKKCQPVAAEVAVYKRKVITDKMAERPTLYFITDYLLTGEIFMEAVAISVEPMVWDGKCTYYYKNGQKKMEGSYSENMPSGTWKYWSEDGLNATVTEFNIFGKPTILNNTVRSSDESYFTVEIDVEYPGGSKEMNKFLTKNLVYPQEAFSRNIMGEVLVSLEINKDGQMQNIRAITKPGFGLEEEAIRVVSMMPVWIIRNHGGEGLTIKKTIPVTFRIP